MLEGGETGIEGAFRVEYTPGHASHHVCYFHEDSGWAFVGDMAGVVVPPNPYTLAPTPPPDIDVEAWERSLETDRGLGARERLALTHFGARRRSAGAARARPRDACASRRGWPASTTRTASSRPTRATSTSRPATAPTRSSRPLRSTSSSSAWTVGAANQGRYPEAPMTETIELPRTGGPGSGLGDNWRVIVRNDDHNTFDHVALTLARTIPGRQRPEGLRLRGRHPPVGPGDGLERAQGARGALLGAAQRRGADYGSARAGLTPGAPLPLVSGPTRPLPTSFIGT